VSRQLDFPERKLVLRAEDGVEMRRWYEALERVQHTTMAVPLPPPLHHNTLHNPHASPPHHSKERNVRLQR